MYTRIFAISSLAFASLAIAQNEPRALEIEKANNKIVNEKGEARYTVGLNPFYVVTLEERAKESGYRQIDPSDGGVDDPEIEIPSVRYAADQIAGLIWRRPTKVRSWVGTEFDIDALPEEIAKLLRVEGVVEIREKNDPREQAVFSQAVIAPGDNYSGAEIIPWYKGYVNTNDSSSFDYATPIHVLDGPMMTPVSSDLVISNYFNNGAYGWAWDPNYWGYWHAQHVDGVIGAKANGQQIRGVNPGHPIKHYGGQPDYLEMTDRVNAIVAASEASFRWSAINISLNNPGPKAEYNNEMEFSKPFGRALAIASNMNLVLQSAGNHNSTACGAGYAFGSSTPEWDGIMLIGGHDSSGYRALHGPNYLHNGIGWVTENSSNYGPCVELWAPSQDITSVRYGTSSTQVLSGTSFSAPIATAIAMRYGGDNTRPLEREWFLKKNSVMTSAGLRSVRWTTAPASQLKRHVISSIWSPQTNVNITNLYNNTYNDMWNSGGNIGTIVIDLGGFKNVKYIRVTPRSSVALSDVFQVDFSVTSAVDSYGNLPGAYQAYSVPKHGDRAPITIPVADISARYIILNGHNYGSWLAYSEIEVYGL